MGGLFGVVSKEDCIQNLFYGTDYHSHLGTRRGGLAVCNDKGFTRSIHSIENAQFRSRFESDVPKMSATMGIGCISDTDSQPLIVRSHLGDYAIVTVGRVNNARKLVDEALSGHTAHFTEMSGGEVSPTELIANLIAQGTTLEVGEKEDAYCASLETCAFPNLGFHPQRQLGPGEIALLTPDGVDQRVAPGSTLRICAFLWVYYGYPSSSIRRDKRRGDALSQRRSPGPRRQHRSRHGRRHTQLRHRPRHRLCQ